MKERARRYISQMPAAISGSGGHLATFNVALALVRGFALPENEAYALLTEWNETHTSKPWSEADLRYKLRSASRSSKPLGYLLSLGGPDCRRPSSSSQREAERKAWLRTLWPQVQPLTVAELQEIASLRQLPFESVDLCSKAGFLARAQIDGHRCFTIGEGLFLQARRFDGEPLTTRDGDAIKAKNLPGCEGAFIGQRWLRKDSPILLVEGAIGLLEATAALVITDSSHWCPLAATSASSRFLRAPDLLKRLRGSRLRIVPDADETGLDAAAAWQAELESVGAYVDALTLPAGAKDLGEVIALHPETHTCLTHLFQ